MADAPAVRARRAARWDLTALFNAADPKAPAVERHVWVIRLFDWLRRAPLADASGSAPRFTRKADAAALPLVRLRHLLGVLERNDEQRQLTAAQLRLFLRDVDGAALLADFGFAPRAGLWSDFGRRLRARVLPLTPATTDLGDLFALLFPDSGDLGWMRELDDATLGRVAALLSDETAGHLPPLDWRPAFFDAITFLASSIRATGFSPALRRRMDPAKVAGSPFHQLARVAERVRELGESADPADRTRFLQETRYLRAVLTQCLAAADSALDHLDQHGVSADVVFDIDQMRRRAHRIDLLLNALLSPAPAPELVALVVELIVAAQERRSVRALFSEHYFLLARKVAERSAATGEHYIARSGAEYASMLGRALGGGVVVAGTVFVKFALLALGLAVFWTGLAAGVNYAVSFVLIQVLGFTLATKQPAMTAPALAAQLADVASDSAVESFVDEVARLIRTQVAGIFGNVLAVVPAVLAAQWLVRHAFGAELVGTRDARHVLETLSLLGPTPLFAVATGVLLFASALVGGWFENWFVWHRIDSAIAWNPRIAGRLGPARARFWSAWWRRNIAGVASNVSLGLMLGLVPALAAVLGLPFDVRHVTLASGQLAAAVGTLGLKVTHDPAFAWCVAGIAVVGLLNLGVSFWLAFRVALRSRDIRVGDRGRIHRAIRRRLWRSPLSFLLPIGKAS